MGEKIDWKIFTAFFKDNKERDTIVEDQPDQMIKKLL